MTAAKSAKDERKDGRIRLGVPLDASGIEGFKPEKPVKVVVKDGKGRLYAQTVDLDEKGKGSANFQLPHERSAFRVYIGPGDASDEELTGLQTIDLTVSPSQWDEKNELTIAPVRIAPYYWFWWLRWCRTFTIRGVVLCPDGSPVPGATVCAFDVDSFWIWASKQLVGCDTTDASGAFEISFRWCCGWWPWWWWRHRSWQLEPALADRILPALGRDPMSRQMWHPTNQPSLDAFHELLAVDGISTSPLTEPVDPARLPGLRDQLLPRLPRIPELEQLRIWPWWPWYPWWDCTPDINFRVTQNCRGQQVTIIDESLAETRWNIPTNLNVTLAASDEACCTQPPDDPEGDCLVIDSACGDLVANIGGNPPGAPGVAAATDGFRNPGVVATAADRPYAGRVSISGRFGVGAAVDYYEFEWSNDDGVSWNSMPSAAAGDFQRMYFGSKLGTADPPAWHPVDFKFNLIDGHNVVESRRHFEANNDPASWGTTRLWWSQTLDLLMNWLTATTFNDGRYRLRVKTWELSGTNLVNPRILLLCDTDDDNGIVLTLDNRLETSGPTDLHGHTCGTGTVHVCTDEPDTEILSVKIIHPDNTETDVGACGNVQVTSSDKLQIDFVAHDPDGHLAYFILNSHYDDGILDNLLPLGTLSPSPVAVPWAPPASQVGNTYAAARSQGAIAPIWHGGALRLTINDATSAFPYTCCYLLELRAHKRTIVNCSDSFSGHHNHSEISFTIIV
jgi:hypothetical protein